jgi:serine/threonine-protein kinase
MLSLLVRETPAGRDEPEVAIGRIIGDRYRVLRHVANGGCSRVFAGAHVELGFPVAIKIVGPRSGRRRSLGDEAGREARITAKLGHPHIVRVLEHGSLERGAHFLVLGWAEGKDLGRLLADGVRLGLHRTLGVLRQAAQALDHAHSRQIVHCDLKPENLIVDRAASDFVTLIDFGIARDADEGGSLRSPWTAEGTADYASPEQAHGRWFDLGPSSDLWSFAAIALEVLTGDRPYPSLGRDAVLSLRRAAPPRRPSELGLDVPGLDAVFDRAMSRRPERRYESAQALVAELERCLLAPRAHTAPGRRELPGAWRVPSGITPLPKTPGARLESATWGEEPRS